MFDLAPLALLWSCVPSAWFLYLFVGVGIVITLITCSGYIAAATTNGCCLSCYSIFLGLLMISELAVVGFISFDPHWQEVIPEDSTGELRRIENFIEDKIDIFKWVALGVMILQAVVLLLAIILREIGKNSTEAPDRDDEILVPRTSGRPLFDKPTTSGANHTGAENRPARNDAWSTRMREKYGLETADFSYNPSESRSSSSSALLLKKEKVAV